MSNHNNNSNKTDLSFPKNVQNAHLHGEGAGIPKFRYQREEVVDAIRTCLQSTSGKAKLPSSAIAYKHLHRHAGALGEVRDILGPPPQKGEHLPDEVWQGWLDVIRDQIHISGHPKQLKFFLSELWGINFRKVAAISLGTQGSDKNSNGNLGGGGSLERPDRNAELVESEVVYEGREAIKQLRQVLSDSSAEQRALTAAELTSFASVIAGATKAAVDQTREYLETMLLIGAGMVFMRFQRRLLDESEYNAFNQNFKTNLKGQLKSVSDVALQSTLGRICRAYRHAMSIHMSVDSPQLSDHARLWEFYKSSLPEIPRLVDKYIDGGFDYRDLNGIPFLPRIGDEQEKESTPTPEKPEWEKHLKILRALFIAANTGSLGDFIKRRSKTLAEVVEATLFTVENVTEFYQSAEGKLAVKHMDEIRKEVRCMYDTARRMS